MVGADHEIVTAGKVLCTGSAVIGWLGVGAAGVGFDEADELAWLVSFNTLIEKLPVARLPFVSVALQLTAVVPILKRAPGNGGASAPTAFFPAGATGAKVCVYYDMQVNFMLMSKVGINSTLIQTTFLPSQTI